MQGSKTAETQSGRAFEWCGCRQGQGIPITIYIDIFLSLIHSSI
nr:MAG TPA: hypothetical protein [Caudoviricetes sp.]DAM65190.1 MAG TPA: hypothetical protein [Caudoviricetes sp.]DAZ48544.1 MAG TPA: hypothetical protein [Caudoviricetes sp.]